jgi:hypothetical protein
MSATPTPARSPPPPVYPAAAVVRGRRLAKASLARGIGQLCLLFVVFFVPLRPSLGSVLAQPAGIFEVIMAIVLGHIARRNLRGTSGGTGHRSAPRRALAPAFWTG